MKLRDQRVAEQRECHAPQHRQRLCPRGARGLLVDAVHIHDRAAHGQIDERNLMQHHHEDDAGARIDIHAQRGEAQRVVDECVPDAARRADDDPGHRQNERREIEREVDRLRDELRVFEVGAVKQQGERGADGDAKRRRHEADPQRVPDGVRDALGRQAGIIPQRPLARCSRRAGAEAAVKQRDDRDRHQRDDDRVGGEIESLECVSGRAALNRGARREALHVQGVNGHIMPVATSSCSRDRVAIAQRTPNTVRQ